MPHRQRTTTTTKYARCSLFSYFVCKNGRWNVSVILQAGRDAKSFTIEFGASYSNFFWLYFFDYNLHPIIRATRWLTIDPLVGKNYNFFFHWSYLEVCFRSMVKVRSACVREIFTSCHLRSSNLSPRGLEISDSPAPKLMWTWKEKQNVWTRHRKSFCITNVFFLSLLFSTQ